MLAYRAERVANTCERIVFASRRPCSFLKIEGTRKIVDSAMFSHDGKPKRNWRD